MSAPPPIILASTSPYRKALFGRLGLPFQTLAPGIDERLVGAEPAEQRALRLAREKAGAIATRQPASIVIGSDQVATLQGDTSGGVLGKPGTRDACRRQLAAMSGRGVEFHTAVSIRHGSRAISHLDLTIVRFRELTAERIEHYIEREPALDCAGGFKCEGLGVTLFESIQTRDPTALVGLPLIPICEALRELGVRV